MEGRSGSFKIKIILNQILNLAKTNQSFLLLFSGAGLISGLLLPTFLQKDVTSTNTSYPERLSKKAKFLRSELRKAHNKLECGLDFTSDYLKENVLEKYFPSKKEKLLPDLADCNLSENFPTLVVDLNKVLIKMEYSHMYGWRPIIRPGAERFFRELVYYYEIVIWSDDTFPLAQEVCAKWSLPVAGALHREHCVWKNGSYVKDLGRLGRKLSRVVILDHDPHAFSYHPENGVLIKEFSGNAQDCDLITMTDFLISIGKNPEKDIRTVLSAHKTRDVNFIHQWEKEQDTKQKQVNERRQLSRKLFGNQLQPKNSLQTDPRHKF